MIVLSIIISADLKNMANSDVFTSFLKAYRVGFADDCVTSY